jgi:LuxR family quorum-sensing system transcriptional regulator SolR
MYDLRISAAELQTLLQIIDRLAIASAGTPDLDDAIAELSELVPFERCVLLHERIKEPGSTTLMYEFSGVPVERTKQRVSARGASRIDCHLDCLERTETLQNAFSWCGNASSDGKRDEEIVALSEQIRASRGVAGTVTSPGGQSDGITLIQLQYGDEQGAGKHLLFVNSIVRHLHHYFVRCRKSFHSAGARHNLTSKEEDVLRWVTEGKTSWEIGTILSVTERTVKFHLHNIYAKLNVVNRAQAVMMANRLSLI